jgi:hypothetical protein
MAPGVVSISKTSNGISLSAETANIMYMDANGVTISSPNIRLYGSLVLSGNLTTNITNTTIVANTININTSITNIDTKITLAANTIITSNLIVNNSVYLTQGSWKRLNTNLTDNTANVYVSSLGNYKLLRIIGYGLSPQSNGTNFTMTLVSSGGTSNNSNYVGKNSSMEHYNLVYRVVNWNSNQITFQHPEYANSPQANSDYLSFELFVSNLGNNKQTGVFGKAFFSSNSNINTQLPSRLMHVQGYHTYLVGYDGIKFNFENGNIKTGTIFIDGIS